MARSPVSHIRAEAQQAVCVCSPDGHPVPGTEIATHGLPSFPHSPVNNETTDAPLVGSIGHERRASLIARVHSALDDKGLCRLTNSDQVYTIVLRDRADWDELPVAVLLGDGVFFESRTVEQAVDAIAGADDTGDWEQLPSFRVQPADTDAVKRFRRLGNLASQTKGE